MDIRPLNDWVVIQAAEAEERTAGGIIIPETAKEKPQWGTVVSAGPGAYKKKEKGKEKEKEFVPTEVKPGDRVLYERYMASEFDFEGSKVIMVRESSILGVIGSGEAAADKPKKAASTAAGARKTAAPRKAAGTAAKKPKTKK